MNIVDEIRSELADAWLPIVYADKVRSQRTRSYSLDIQPRQHRPEILHTLLGIELKVGNKRFACPDLSTARYLRVFARAGCREFAVPYDITKIPAAADEFETSWHRMLLLLEDAVKGRPASAMGRLRSNLIRVIREEIEKIGPGEKMPEFRRDTKHRKK